MNYQVFEYLFLGYMKIGKKGSETKLCQKTGESQPHIKLSNDILWNNLIPIYSFNIPLIRF